MYFFKKCRIAKMPKKVYKNRLTKTKKILGNVRCTVHCTCTYSRVLLKNTFWVPILLFTPHKKSPSKRGGKKKKFPLSLTPYKRRWDIPFSHIHYISLPPPPPPLSSSLISPNTVPSYPPFSPQSSVGGGPSRSEDRRGRERALFAVQCPKCLIDKKVPV